MKHNFKNLKIWMLSMEITSDIHKIGLEFPKNEVYGLVSQMNRGAVSMPSNIAEGSNRGNNHFKHYLNISLGSSFELQTQLLIANQNKYLSSLKNIDTDPNKFLVLGGEGYTDTFSKKIEAVNSNIKKYFSSVGIKQ